MLTNGIFGYELSWVEWGVKPHSLMMKEASREARRISAAVMRSTPPPIQRLCTAAITGFLIARTAAKSACHLRINLSNVALRSA